MRTRLPRNRESAIGKRTRYRQKAATQSAMEMARERGILPRNVTRASTPAPAPAAKRPRTPPEAPQPVMREKTPKGTPQPQPAVMDLAEVGSSAKSKTSRNSVPTPRADADTAAAGSSAERAATGGEPALDPAADTGAGVGIGAGAGAAPKCARAKCGCDAFHGGYFCSKTCRGRVVDGKVVEGTGVPCKLLPSGEPPHRDCYFNTAVATGRNPCARNKCPCTRSFDNAKGNFCCRRCKDGAACLTNVHSAELDPIRALPCQQPADPSTLDAPAPATRKHRVVIPESDSEDDEEPAAVSSSGSERTSPGASPGQTPTPGPTSPNSDAPPPAPAAANDAQQQMARIKQMARRLEVAAQRDAGSIGVVSVDLSSAPPLRPGVGILPAAELALRAIDSDGDSSTEARIMRAEALVPVSSDAAYAAAEAAAAKTSPKSKGKKRASPPAPKGPTPNGKAVAPASTDAPLREPKRAKNVSLAKAAADASRKAATAAARENDDTPSSDEDGTPARRHRDLLTAHHTSPPWQNWVATLPGFPHSHIYSAMIEHDGVTNSLAFWLMPHVVYTYSPDPTAHSRRMHT